MPRLSIVLSRADVRRHDRQGQLTHFNHTPTLSASNLSLVCSLECCYSKNPFLWTEGNN